MNSSLLYKYILQYGLTATWIATAIIGFSGFFLSHDLLTVSLFEVAVPDSIHIAVASIAFGLPVIAVFTSIRKASWLFTIALLAYVVLIVLDLNRLAPYMIMYYALFSTIIFLRYDTSILFTSVLFICAGIYVCSGLHKINPAFVASIAPKLWIHLLPIKYNVSIGYGMAIGEFLLGLGLLFKRTRKWSIVLLIASHLLILWKLGPFNYNWNAIIWPWNIFMIVCLISIWKLSGFCKIKVGSARVFIGTSVLFFWVLPLLSIVTVIPENVSFKLYSGVNKNAWITLPDDASTYNLDNYKKPLSLTTYAIKERQLAPNPELLVFKRILDNFKSKVAAGSTMQFKLPKKSLDNLTQTY